MSTLGTVPAGKIWLGDFKKSESHLGNCASWLRNILIDLENCGEMSGKAGSLVFSQIGTNFAQRIYCAEGLGFAVFILNELPNLFRRQSLQPQKSISLLF